MLGIKFFVGCFIICSPLGSQGMKEIEVERDMNISSPNFPNPYPANVDVSWRFKKPHGRWAITFHTLDIQFSLGCEADRLDIYDGLSSDRPTYRYCNKHQVQPYLSKESTIKIHFMSDGSGESKGFQLEVVHVVTDEDYDKLMEKRMENAAEIIIEEGEKDRLTFRILVVVVSVASIVFVGLLLFLIITLLSRRRQKARDTLLDLQPQSTFVHVNPSGRRYSRGNSDNRNDKPTSTTNEERRPVNTRGKPGLNSYI